MKLPTNQPASIPWDDYSSNSNALLLLTNTYNMSFPGRILASKNIFKPALHYLSNLDPSNKAPSSPQQKYADQNDIDSSPPGPSHTQYMAPLRPWHSRDSSGELDHAGGIPLIDYSRTPSPSPYRTRTRSATQSEDEDEAAPLSLRPLVADGEDEVDELRKNWWRIITNSGSLGEFLFGTWLGWQVWVCLLIIWNIGVGFTLTLMNRFILWSKKWQALVVGTKANTLHSRHI